jgi:DNA-directed RNA polymerase specialized sigma24 family protein
MSKRLAKLLTNPMERPTEPASARTHVHKLAHRLTAEEVAVLQDAYLAGASLGDLQQRFGLSRGSVQWLLREGGVRRRRKSLTDTEVAGLVERYEAGLTIREIAAEQGLAKSTVQDALAQAAGSHENGGTATRATRIIPYWALLSDWGLFLPSPAL